MQNSSAEVRFGSFLTYSPRGLSKVSQDSRTVTYAIKHDGKGAIREAAKKLAAWLGTQDAAPLAEFLHPGAILVPCPRSTLRKQGSLWPPLRIAEELVAAGLGKEVQLLLERFKVAPSSSSAERGERPGIRTHLDTLRVVPSPPLLGQARLLVVDDVTTRGATLWAAVSLLKEQFPQSEVKAFAMVRTLGRQPEVERIVDPCVGTIRNVGGGAVREP